MVTHGYTWLHMVVIGVIDLGDSSDLVVSHLGNEQVTNIS